MARSSKKEAAPGGPEPRRVAPDRPGPPGGKRDQNRRERTRAIGDAALSLFVEYGVESVTIDQIVAAAGIAKGSFYRYFDDKADVVQALLSLIASDLRAAFDACEGALSTSSAADIAAAYEEFGAWITATIFAHPTATLLYLQESRAPPAGACKPIRALADEITERAVKLAQLGRKTGLMREADPTVSALTVVGASERMLFAVLSGSDLGDPATVARELIGIFLDGLRVREG